VRRADTSQEPRAPGSAPSVTTLASVMLSVAEPANRSARVPSRFSIDSSDDRRSPYLTLKPPVASSKPWMVSGLNALVKPNRRYGSWISTPSMTVRF
jgi:hypothetical protein